MPTITIRDEYEKKFYYFEAWSPNRLWNSYDLQQTAVDDIFCDDFLDFQGKKTCYSSYE